MKGDNTSEATYYIPWESCTACHSIEVIASKLENVSLWKPEYAKVTFSAARAWLQVPLGNAVSGTQKDVGDFGMKFLKLGDEAPLNLTIFQN